MKRIYSKKTIGYLAGGNFYCNECWNEYLKEKKMTGMPSIDEEVWEHDLLSEEIDEVEDLSETLICSRCNKVFGPEEAWKKNQVLVHE